MTITSSPRPLRRLAQVDSRKRLTLSEADPECSYYVVVQSDDSIVLTKDRRHRGRAIRVDSRRRIQLSEMKPWGLYFVTKNPHNGTVTLDPAVAMPLRTAIQLRMRASA